VGEHIFNTPLLSEKLSQAILFFMLFGFFGYG